MSTRPLLQRGCLLALVVSLVACARIPFERYGIEQVTIQGSEAMDPDALAVCLASRPRERISLRLGMSATPSCGSSPFDNNATTLRLWSWTWTTWPLFDQVVLERDMERVVRWYRARGYYDARVLDYWTEPESAMISDTIGDDPPCDRRSFGQGCTVSIFITVEEGEPVRLSEIDVQGLDGLPEDVIRRIESSLPLQVGDRLDEAYWERAKRLVREILVDESYARAEVSGLVRIDRERLQAAAHLEVQAGEPCLFGRVVVRGHGDLPHIPIVEATAIYPGLPYSSQALFDAQSAVWNLGAFNSVNLIPDIPESGNRIDVIVEVVPAKRSRFQFGVGMQSGLVSLGARESREEVPQWDLHFLATWEHRSFLGGLRRIRIQEQPRVIFPEAFPTTEDPSLGNIVNVLFQQPGFLESRTNLAIDLGWELGPSPFLGIFRHELDTGLRLDRHFFRRKLHLSAGLRERVFLVPEGAVPRISGATIPSNYDLMFFEQNLRVDLRDDPLRTRIGFHFSLDIQEAGFILPSSWSYLRIVPDLRGYLPLFFHWVLVGRFSLGYLIIEDADSNLDEPSRVLGPTTERMRGGGGSSHRGFYPGELGDGPEGGLRRWLASLELRIPITRSFFLTVFGDMGDVSQQPQFRFDHPQTAVGMGLRLLTLLGPIRLDFGWRVPGLQVLADDDFRSPGGRTSNVGLWGFGSPVLFRFAGAVNLTIGDPF